MSPLPNWPKNGPRPVDPVVPPPPAPVAPVLSSIQDAKAAGAVEGTILSAPLAPASGPVNGKPESLVVVTLKTFWQSATIKALKNAVLTAIGLAFGVVATQIVVAGGAVSNIDWNVTLNAAIAAAAFSIASAYAAWWKKHDNNVVQ